MNGGMISDLLSIGTSKDVFLDSFDTLRGKRSIPPRQLVLLGFLFRIIFVFWVVFLAEEGYAQELEPRSYTNTPVGLNFLIAGDSYLKGSVLTDPSEPLKDAKIQAQMPIF